MLVDAWLRVGIMARVLWETISQPLRDAVLTIKDNHIDIEQAVSDSKNSVLSVPLEMAKASGMRFRYVCACRREHEVDALAAWHSRDGSGKHECECGLKLLYRLKGIRHDLA